MSRAYHFQSRIAADVALLAGAVTFYRTRKEEPSRMVPSNTIVRTYLLQYQIFRAMMCILTPPLIVSQLVLQQSNGTFFQVMLPWHRVQSVAIGLRKENPPLKLPWWM